MTYDGGIRIAKYKMYTLPFSTPWAIGAFEEGLIPDRAIISIDQLPPLFEKLVQYVKMRGKENEAL